MINFDALPTELESNYKVLPKGIYKAMIAEAMMKNPKDPKKPPYLSVRWELYNDDMSEKIGTVFDTLTESESNVSQVKLRKFLTATGVDLGKQFELRDVAKVCKGKWAIITIKVEPDNNGQDRNVIDVFNDPYVALTTRTPIDPEPVNPAPSTPQKASASKESELADKIAVDPSEDTEVPFGGMPEPADTSENAKESY